MNDPETLSWSQSALGNRLLKACQLGSRTFKNMSVQTKMSVSRSHKISVLWVLSSSNSSWFYGALLESQAGSSRCQNRVMCTFQELRQHTGEGPLDVYWPQMAISQKLDADWGYVSFCLAAGLKASIIHRDCPLWELASEINKLLDWGWEATYFYEQNGNQCGGSHFYSHWHLADKSTCECGRKWRSWDVMSSAQPWMQTNL